MMRSCVVAGAGKLGSNCPAGQVILVIGAGVGVGVGAGVGVGVGAGVGVGVGVGAGVGVGVGTGVGAGVGVPPHWLAVIWLQAFVQAQPTPGA